MGWNRFQLWKRTDRIDRLNQYIDSTRRAKVIVRETNTRVFISNYSLFDEAVEKLESLPHQVANPFAMTVPDVERALTVMQECALATLVYWSKS